MDYSITSIELFAEPGGEKNIDSLTHCMTKASDIIRRCTYDAFFTLIATAVIYFAVTYIFIVLFNLSEKKIDPKRRRKSRISYLRRSYMTPKTTQ